MELQTTGTLAPSAGAAAVSGPCFFYGAQLYDTTGDAVFNAYQGSGGKELATMGASDEVQSAPPVILPHGIFCPGGIYYDLVGAASEAIIYFSR